MATLEQQAIAEMRRERSFISRLPSKTVWFVRGYPLGAFGAFFAVLLIAMAIVPSVFATHDPYAQALGERLDGVAADHWFGQDPLGRDLYSRIVYGARTSILIGFGITIIGNSLTSVLGILSGHYGGVFDLIFQRMVDIVIALPGLVFIMIFVTSLRDRVGGDIPAIIFSIALLTAVGGSRTIRGVALQIREHQYVEAAKACGAGNARIMFQHMLPNVFPIILVAMSLTVGVAVLIESSLSFLGYGVQPPTPSWGRMLSDAREYLVRAPHVAIFPGFLIFLTVFSFNMLGDALRDILDPRMRGSR